MGSVFEFAFLLHNEIKISKNDASLGTIENNDISAALFDIFLEGMPACLTRFKS